MRETFYIDGEDARNVGIQLQQPIEFSAAEPIIQKLSIPGRNGDLIIDTGAYKNRSGSGKCFALQTNVQFAVDSASSFLLRNTGYRRLECSNDPGFFWLARVVNGASIENRMRTLNPFAIKFDCKPQRFSVDGEYPIEYQSAGEIVNYYSGLSKPIITVYGSGFGSVSIGDTKIEIKDMSDVLFIDSENMNAYDDKKESKNGDILAPEFPVIKPGANGVSFSGGVKKISIIPRWWSI